MNKFSEVSKLADISLEFFEDLRDHGTEKQREDFYDTLSVIVKEFRDEATTDAYSQDIAECNEEEDPEKYTYKTIEECFYEHQSEIEDDIHNNIEFVTRNIRYCIDSYNNNKDAKNIDDFIEKIEELKKVLRIIRDANLSYPLTRLAEEATIEIAEFLHDFKKQYNELGQ